ncbi:hypothetical protein Dimus_009135 [Dionaea muscipula]
MKNAIAKHPGLAVVLVGNRSDSHSFVRIKMKACAGVGITSLTKVLPEDCSEDEILHVVSGLNKDPSIHGIIVQLPLPEVIFYDYAISSSSFIFLVSLWMLRLLPIQCAAEKKKWRFIMYCFFLK